MIPIVTGKDTPVLNRPSEAASFPLSPDIKKLIPEMIETMQKAKGVGLAAPQINVPLRLCVTEHDPGDIRVFLNPEITTHSQEKVVFEEGCLSLPGQFFPIIRSEKITVKYQSESGLPKKLRVEGFLAIVLQHEIDHLNGTLIINRHAKQKGAITKIYGRIVE